MHGFNRMMTDFDHKYQKRLIPVKRALKTSTSKTTCCYLLTNANTLLYGDMIITAVNSCLKANVALAECKLVVPILTR